MAEFRMLSALIIMFATGCALPAEDKPPNTFIPNKEIQAAKLVQEALTFNSGGRAVDAEFDLLQAQYLYPELPNIKVNLAIVLQNQGRYEEAAAILEKLLSASSSVTDQISYLRALGGIYYNWRKFVASKAAYEKVLTLLADKGDMGGVAQVARSLSVLSFAFGDEDSAYCYSSLALSIKNDKDEVTRHARLMLALNLSAKARDLVFGTLSSSNIKFDPELFIILALSLYEEGRVKESSEYVETVAQSGKLEENLEREKDILRLSLNFDYYQNNEEPLLRIKELFNQGAEETYESISLYWPARFLSNYYSVLLPILISE